MVDPWDSGLWRRSTCDPAVEAILPRAETPAEIAALALTSETASGRLLNRVDGPGAKGPVVTMSRDELRELSDRLYRLAQVARQHHAYLTQGRRCEAVPAPELAPTWRDRLAAWRQRFIRTHHVGDVA